MTADGGHLHLDVNMCWLYAYIEVCNFHNVKELHFTHYGFVNGVFRYEEIKAILNVLLTQYHS